MSFAVGTRLERDAGSRFPDTCLCIWNHISGRILDRARDASAHTGPSQARRQNCNDEKGSNTLAKQKVQLCKQPTVSACETNLIQTIHDSCFTKCALQIAAGAQDSLAIAVVESLQAEPYSEESPTNPAVAPRSSQSPPRVSCGDLVNLSTELLRLLISQQIQYTTTSVRVTKSRYELSSFIKTITISRFVPG
jgi:hypothetical protein